MDAPIISITTIMWKLTQNWKQYNLLLIVVINETFLLWLTTLQLVDKN